MTFNIDPVGATLLGIIIFAGYRGWDSLQRKIDTRHAEALETFQTAFKENKERRAELVRDNEKAHEAIGERIGDLETEVEEQDDRIDGLRRDVDGHGYRLTAVENRGT